ncbi:hypothetical protein BS47DRAFT_1395750 [Hydnum rufescens UP504]|uniref:Uncharacterized protein n=1 Tax=Hydnum rufescens UP504 TaxID=1448309 RepID=A0A9P6ARK4_9AGAM|nr:hypothetical protein BS47DRAFT_1395750 [Hydnum rufescens UP504]
MNLWRRTKDTQDWSSKCRTLKNRANIQIQLETGTTSTLPTSRFDVGASVLAAQLLQVLHGSKIRLTLKESDSDCTHGKRNMEEVPPWATDSNLASSFPQPLQSFPTLPPPFACIPIDYWASIEHIGEIHKKILIKQMLDEADEVEDASV